MPSICELKIELKSKGIKGITGLNKSGLEALLKGGKSEAKKKEPKPEVPKPKPFTPAPTKGESPKVAEKKIDKKITAPKMLTLTYKEPKNEPKNEPKKQVKIQSEKLDQKTLERIKKIFEPAGPTIANCKEFLCKYNIYSKDDYKQWLLKNHPDKGGTIHEEEFKAIVLCASKNKFCKKPKEK